MDRHKNQVLNLKMVIEKNCEQGKNLYSASLIIQKNLTC